MNRTDEIWKERDLANRFLENVRSAIPMAAAQIDVMLRIVRNRVPDGCSFIDLGCGDGILGRTIHAMYPLSTGILLDFSESMIEAAREKAEPSEGKLSFVLGDYARSDWTSIVRDRTPFDLVVSGYSIHHQPDERKKSLYQEIFDLLKPGGLFLNLDTVAPDPEWTEEIWENLFIDSLFAFEQSRGSDRTRDQVAAEWMERPDRAANILAPLDIQCDWLTEAGFEDVACYFKVLEQALFGGVKPL